jgi:phytoene/squalene synthetase
MAQFTLASRDTAAGITWRSSHQAFWTIRLLVDRARVPDAFRAYGYFRWVDDRLDLELAGAGERRLFLRRQQALIEACYAGREVPPIEPEEQMVADLIRGNPQPSGGLASYIQNMMRVMRFDSERRGRLISQAELDGYTHWLAIAVTDALHWFIGNSDCLPDAAMRYQAASAAHIAHMLRDSYDDLRHGYFNIPRQVLRAGGIAPADIATPAYRRWVRERVSEARHLFDEGRAYLAQVHSARCRLAGLAYCQRFAWVLEAIEADGYLLRPDYYRPRSLQPYLGCLAEALIPIRRPAPRVTTLRSAS